MSIQGRVDDAPMILDESQNKISQPGVEIYPSLVPCNNYEVGLILIFFYKCSVQKS